MSLLDLASLGLVAGWVPVIVLILRRWIHRRHPLTMAFLTLVLFAMYLNLAPIFARSGVGWGIVRSGIYIAELGVLVVFYLCLALASRWTPPQEDP